MTRSYRLEENTRWSGNVGSRHFHKWRVDGRVHWWGRDNEPGDSGGIPAERDRDLVRVDGDGPKSQLALAGSGRKGARVACRGGKIAPDRPHGTVWRLIVR